MERQCISCNQIKKSPYKNYCRNCYQKQWIKVIPEKICDSCNSSFKNSGKKCHGCMSNLRNEKSKSLICSNCNRTGLIIRNKTEILCIRCNRQKNEAQKPEEAQKRKDYNMIYSRKKKGTDLTAPRRKSTGKWKSNTGYVLLYKPTHMLSNANGSILEHVYVMCEHLNRFLFKGETVHHINGIRDDNRIENLELWSNSHPSGQRVEDKIKWAKQFLHRYGFTVN